MELLKKPAGFSLLELVAVIVLLGILSSFLLPRLRTSDAALLTQRDLIITTLNRAQQIAMARDSASNPITVVIASESIDIRENGVSISQPGFEYPLIMPAGITITAGTGVLNYDKLGQTSATTIALNGNNSILVEESGYAH